MSEEVVQGCEYSVHVFDLQVQGEQMSDAFKILTVAGRCPDIEELSAGFASLQSHMLHACPLSKEDVHWIVVCLGWMWNIGSRGECKGHAVHTSSLVKP